MTSNSNKLKNYKLQPKAGYIAITTSLILSLVMLILAISIGSSTLLTRYNTVDFSNKRASHYAAFSCLEYARLKLAESASYAGNATTSAGTYQCYILSVEISGANKIIKSRSIVGGATTNLKLTVNSNTLSTVSLEEAVKF